MAERITFVTPDDVTIVGDWSPAPTLVGAVILLHMMPQTRSSWAVYLRTLNKRGLAGLAIDLRGHGESVAGPGGSRLDYREFSDAEHQSAAWDVSGAVDWVRARGIELDRITLAGASIGSSLCIRQLADEPSMPGALLLSPGNYRGMNVLEDAQMLGAGQSLFITASEEDIDSIDVSRKLFEQAPVQNKTFVPFRGGGHGTALFTHDLKLMDRTAEWLLGITAGG